MVGGETRKTTLSEFASSVAEQDATLFQRKLPQITQDELELFGKLLTRPVPTNDCVQKCLKDFRRVQRLRDHELDTPNDPEEASTPTWKYTRDDSPSASRAGPSSASTSHQGFTSLSLASVTAFGSRTKSDQKKVWPKSAAAAAPRPDRSKISSNGTKANSAIGLSVSVPHRPAKATIIQPKPPLAIVASSNPPLKIFSAPPKPANSAFRPPTFIAHGATPNLAGVTGVKRRLGMGHLAGGSSTMQKTRKVDKEGRSAGGT